MRPHRARDQAPPMLRKVREYAPGTVLCAAIAAVCWWLGASFPVVGGPVFGILFGMLAAVFWKPESRIPANPGIAFTSKKVLQLAVVFLGFGLDIAQVVAVGASSLPVILATIGVALASAFAISKALRIPGRTATLVGVGSSICGGSAIAATAPVIKATDEEVAQAISVIFLFNVIAALVFPTLGTALGLSNEGFALFAGTAVNDTSSVTAAAAAWEGMHPGSWVLEDATVVKLTRTLAIIPITLVLALWGARKDAKGAKAADVESSFSLKRAFPMFILWFVAASLVTTAALLLGASADMFAPLKGAAKFLIIMAMAAIGLNTDIVKLVRSGAKPLLLGFCCCILIAGASLGMQALMGAL